MKVQSFPLGFNSTKLVIASRDNTKVIPLAFLSVAFVIFPSCQSLLAVTNYPM